MNISKLLKLYKKTGHIVAVLFLNMKAKQLTKIMRSRMKNEQEIKIQQQ